MDHVFFPLFLLTNPPLNQLAVYRNDPNKQTWEPKDNSEVIFGLNCIDILQRYQANINNSRMKVD